MDLAQFNIRFKLFGIPVCIMPSFWVLCIILSPFITLRTSEEQPWICGAAGWIAALLSSFLIHEEGHALAARRLFRVAPEIALGMGRSPSGAFVFGGVSSWRNDEATNPSRARAILATSAGPLAAIGAALLGLGIAALAGSKILVYHKLGFLPVALPCEWVAKCKEPSGLALFVGYFSLGFFWINFFWSYINLMPIYPLDGGKILMSFAKTTRGMRCALYVSVVCSILLGGLFCACGSWLAGCCFFFTGFFSFQAARSLEQSY